MTGRSMEIVLFVKETQWKGKEAGSGNRLFCCTVKADRNGFGIILDAELTKSVVEVNQKSDCLFWMNIETSREVINLASAYAPGGIRSGRKGGPCYSVFPKMNICGWEVTWTARWERTTSEQLNGETWILERNEGGEIIINFATTRGLTIMNTFFEECDSTKFTYTSGRRNTQVDYIWSWKTMCQLVTDCKVLPGDCLAQQHKPVVFIALMKNQVHPKVMWQRKPNGGG